MLDKAELSAAVERRAIIEFSDERVRHSHVRLACYLGATSLAFVFLPAAWVLLCMTLLLVTKLRERQIARDLLAAAPGDAFDRAWRRLRAAYLLTAAVTGFVIAVVWVLTDSAHNTFPLSLLFMISLAAAIDSRHMPGLLMIRQAIYGSIAVALACRDLVTSWPVGPEWLVINLIPVSAFAICALRVSHWSARLYRENLEREAQLAAARDAAEAERAAKGAFVATLSHELRTPLNGILGMAQTLLLSGLTPRQQEQANVIAEAGHSLNALLTDVLEYSKLDAGKMAIAPAEADPRATARQVEKLFAPLAIDKGLAFRVTIAPDVPDRLVFDAARFRQCLSNLVSNAIKFTDGGGVTLHLSCDGASEDDACTLLATVTDTGIGIPLEDQPRLFRPFSQADGTISRRYGGTGLGLSITRQLAEAMHGSVEVESSPGSGSTFRLSIRAGRGGAPVIDLAGRRILVADDTDTNRALIRLLLEPLGASVVEARGGREALDALAAGGFAAAFLDMNMPDLGGAEIAARLRQAGGGPVLIAMTADSSAPDIGPGGFDAVLPRPINPRALRTAVADALRRQADPERGKSAGA